MFLSLKSFSHSEIKRFKYHFALNKSSIVLQVLYMFNYGTVNHICGESEGRRRRRKKPNVRISYKAGAVTQCGCTASTNLVVWQNASR